jgi:L-asparaginase II
MERENPFSPQSDPPLPACGDDPLEVVLIRGGGVESRHRVHVLALRDDGEEEFRWGRPDFSFFPRSTLKMIQAIPWLALPEARKLLKGKEEIAIACGSHHGKKFHVDLVSSWLERLGVTAKALECGIHDPANKQAFIEMIRRGEQACEIHNNCSGKHCGFLTWAKVQGWELEGYSNYGHPLQKELREFCSNFLETNLEERAWGIDGCGIPTYWLQLKELALGMVKLARAEPPEFGEDILRIQSAISEYPYHLGGTLDFSSRVVAETKGSVFAKVGAEGVYGLWIPGQKFGMALKCEDGNPRACEAAIVRLLGELGLSIHFHSTLAHRWSGEVVGQFIVG